MKNIDCFNSMIVRLKAPGFSSFSSDSNTFQFYDSPIKSAYEFIETFLEEEFQFYDSPIKRQYGRESF